MNPKLIIEQKITAFVNKYAVYTTDASGEKAQLAAYAQQKRLAFKEKVTFFADESQTQPIFTFRAEKVLDVHGRYIIEDIQGNFIGSFKKDFKQSFLKSTWNILDSSDQPKVTITESNLVLALLRRYGGFIPFVGVAIDYIAMFLRYHFSFIDTSTNQEIGQYQKITLFRDHYKLSMTDEAYSKYDWRTLAAMAVALDALQSR